MNVTVRQCWLPIATRPVTAATSELRCWTDNTSTYDITTNREYITSFNLLGQWQECYLSRVAGNTEWSHMAQEYPKQWRLVAHCYTLFTFTWVNCILVYSGLNELVNVLASHSTQRDIFPASHSWLAIENTDCGRQMSVKDTRCSINTMVCSRSYAITLTVLYMMYAVKTNGHLSYWYYRILICYNHTPHELINSMAAIENSKWHSNMNTTRYKIHMTDAI